MKYILVVFLMFYAGVSCAQSSTKIQMPRSNVNYSYTDLLDYVDQRYSDKEDIARFFYLWIAQNIEYDDDVVYQFKRSLDPELLHKPTLEVFETRLAICSGYASLYKLFLNEFDIECEVVDGFSKNKEEIIGDEGMLTHHAWNAILLNGNWHLVDPTWANTSSTNGKMTEYHFKTPPDLFLFNHFPIIAFWQLQDDPIPFDEFQRLPNVYANYFELGFDHTVPKVLIEDNQAKLVIANSKKWRPALLKRTKDQLYEPISFERIKKGEVQELIFTISDTEKSVIRLDVYKFVDISETQTYSQLVTFGFDKTN